MKLLKIIIIVIISGYLSNIHSAGDSVIVIHAFEIPPLPYSSGPCKFNEMFFFFLFFFLTLILYMYRWGARGRYS